MINSLEFKAILLGHNLGLLAFDTSAQLTIMVRLTVHVFEHWPSVFYKYTPVLSWMQPGSNYNMLSTSHRESPS